MLDTSVIEKYLNGSSLAALGREYNVPAIKIRKFLVENNIRIRSQKEQNKYSPQNQRKYKINDLYFSKQSSNMAYLLGFFAADGCVYEKDNGIKLTLARVDHDFLEKIKEELEATYPVKKYSTEKGYENSEFRFTSLQIKKDFADYNIVPKKTYNYTFPQKLKKEYYRDFIRGYFDGDGSVSTAGPGAIRWQVCSHEKDVLYKIISFFEEQDIPKVSIYKTKGKELYYIQYSTTATRKIFNILYYDDCFCLPRKYEKFKLLMK